MSVNEEKNLGKTDRDRKTDWYRKVKVRLVWFNVSVLYSAFSGGIAVNASGAVRVALAFLAIHGALWAVFRALEVIEAERILMSFDLRR